MQVALNYDDKYDRGRLIFLTYWKICHPIIPEGSITIQDNNFFAVFHFLRVEFSISLSFLKEEWKII
jgi:hypothetical protein